MNYFGPDAICADRWTPYADQIIVEGLDTNGIQVAMQVRQYPDAPGNPLISIGGVGTAAEQGLHTIDVDNSGVVPVSTIGVRINDLSGMPPAAEIGDDAVFAWDLLMSVDGVLQRVASGPFIVRAGVTRP